MNAKHLNEEQLVLFHYGEEMYAEAEARREVSDHLAGCTACRESYASLQRVLTAVESLPVPAREEGYGQEVWMRVRPRLGAVSEKAPRSSWSWWLTPQRWAMAGAVAALLLAAFLIGTRWPRPGGGGQSAQQEIPAQARERILMVAVGNHLEKSQMVLVELSNMPAQGKVDISSEQRMASELVGENRLYRQTALNAGEAGVANVLDQLERVLVEVANSPSEVSSKELESLRKRIESQGILFKIRVIGSDVRQRAKQAPADAGSQAPAGQPRKKI